MVLRVQGWVALALMLATTTASAASAGNWQKIFSESGRRVEVDRTSIAKDADGKVTAWGRIVFDRVVPDAYSGGGYRILEAMNRYDCDRRVFSTLKRIYRRDEQDILREEESRKPVELPVRSGTLDEKVLRVACRPAGLEGARHDFAQAVGQANEAAAGLRKINDGLVRREVMRADLSQKLPAAPKAAAREDEARTAAHEPTPRPVKAAAKRRAPAPEPLPLHWSYEGPGGPENWAKLGPENRLCGDGQRQSPIDARDGIGVDLAPIEFNYRLAPFRIVDTGRTVQVAVGDHRIRVLGKDYQLVNVHFHRPGEERVAGRSFAMTAHFEHRADDGKLAIVAVQLDPGREHPLIQTLWNHLPLEKNDEVAPPEPLIDLTQLLPEDRRYLTYMGSLTTPPCSEGVLWLVLKQPVELSSEQIAVFSRLYGHNARPIQPTNGRLVKESR